MLRDHTEKDVANIDDLQTAIRDAIKLGFEGDSIGAIEILIDRFPSIADEIEALIK